MYGIAGVFLFFLMCILSSYGNDILTVYSSRKTQLLQSVVDEFSNNSDIMVRLRTDKAAPLIQRIISEGEQCVADVLLTVDAGNLWYAKQKGLFIPHQSDTIKRHVQVHLRDIDNMWSGISIRARTIVYHPQRVSKQELATLNYKTLGDSQWKGRVALRTSKKVYNQSLVAMLIEKYGHDATKKILQGWVSNLSSPVFAKDNAVLNAVENGIADVGIVNTYYYGRMIKKNSELSIRLHFPNGTHVNVSGIGILKHAKNKPGARQFIDWLISKNAQGIIANNTMEYPIRTDVSPNPIVTSWGVPRFSDISLVVYGQRQKESILLMKEVGYR